MTMHVRRLASVLAFATFTLAGPARAADTRAFVLTTDFSSGSMSAVNLTTRAVSVDVAGVHSDATARWDHGLLFVVNRLGQDNIQVIDPAAGYATVLQFSTGNGSNPQDIAFVSPTRAYVSRLGTPSLLIVNPATGGTLGSVPLGAFADADGNPEAARMIVVGRYLFVALERLANFVATDTSLVVVVDTQADTVLDVDPALPGTQAIVLAGTNPTTSFAFDAVGRRLLLGCTGHYGANDGGIVAIPLDAPVTFAPFVIDEAALGGDVLDLVWNGAEHSYAIVSDAAFVTHLVSWSAVTHLPLASFFTPGGFSLADCDVNDRGELYVCDNDFGAPGLFVFRAGADTLIAGPLNTGLPPAYVVFDHAAGVAGVEPPLPPTLAFSAPTPNPARSVVRFTLTLPHPGELVVEAFDLSGRCLRRLHEGAGQGRMQLTWDLRDDDGRPLTVGLYLVRARVRGATEVRRILVIR
jgi:hypothetical protein